MANFALILICLLAGVILKRLGRFHETAALSLNAFVINLSLPAVILVQVPALLQTTSLDSSLLVPASMAWLQLLLSLAVFGGLGSKFGWSRAKTGALVLCAGLGNTSFVGFPVLEALLGKEGLRIGLVIDQTGSFLALSTLGLALAAYFGGSKVSAQAIAKRIAYFPPFVALVLSILWYLSGTYEHGPITSMLEKIGGTLVPLALVSVGLQLRVNGSVLRRRWFALSCGLGYKLVALPALLAFLYIVIAQQSGVIVHATLIEAAMAPMITAAIVSTDFHLDSEIANLMVGVGIPLSLITVPLWHIGLSNLL